MTNEDKKKLDEEAWEYATKFFRELREKTNGMNEQEEKKYVEENEIDKKFHSGLQIIKEKYESTK